MLNPKYYYGLPTTGNHWSDVANIFASHESVNSEKTSSIPLFSFWRPSSLKDRLQTVNEKYHCLYDSLTFCFEYAVPVNKDCRGRGKASMTDLMVFGPNHVIAIEGKYTECRQKYQSIFKWRGAKAKNGDNKYNVLEGWLNYIQGAQATGITNVNEICMSKTIPYQLVHRVASACKVANDEGKKPVVIYHLFYDQTLRKQKDKFLKELVKATDKLKLSKIKLLVVETEVTPPRLSL